MAAVLFGTQRAGVARRRLRARAQLLQAGRQQRGDREPVALRLLVREQLLDLLGGQGPDATLEPAERQVVVVGRRQGCRGPGRS